MKSYKTEFKSYIFNHQSTINSIKISIHSNQLYQNSENIIWEDENKEIVYNGILYDIVSIEKKSENVILTVVSDTQEAELKKEFESQYDVISQKSTSHPIKLLKQFLALKCIINQNEINPILANGIIKNNTINSYNIQSGFIYIEIPPPNFI